MITVRSTIFVILSLTLSSCCSLPTWFFGETPATITISKEIKADAGTQEYDLCSTSESGKLGVTALRKKQYKKALEHFEKAYQASKGAAEDGHADPGETFNYALLLEHQSDFEKALKIFDELSDRVPSQKFIDCHVRIARKIEDEDN